MDIKEYVQKGVSAIMIKCFTYENFKSFEKAELNIESFTTLIGANSSGKSNAIEGISILANAMTGLDLSVILDGSKNGNSIVRGGSHGCPRFKASAFRLGCLVEWSGDNDLLYEIKIRVNGSVMVEEEGLYLVKTDELGPKRNKVFKTKPAEKDRVEIKVQYKNGKQGKDPDIICVRSAAILPQMINKISRDREEQREIVAMMETVADQLKGIKYLNPVPSEMRDYVRTTDIELRTNCANLSAVLNKICKYSEKKQFLLEFIKELPENDVTDIEFVTTKIGDVIFALKEKSNNTPELVDARLLSDGTLRCIAVLTAALTSDPGNMIMIEEIDNGIHPAKVYKLIEQLIQIGKERKIDLVITTHNAALMNSYKKDELIGVSTVYREKEKGTSKIISLVDIDDFPEMLLSGGLGNAMIDDGLMRALKNGDSKKDYSWLGV